MADRDFGMIRPFDIDSGQLDGLTPQQCFVLGYELALVDESLKACGAFERLIHAENKDRITAECDKQGRGYTVVWMQGDSSESWMTLKVHG